LEEFKQRKAELQDLLQETWFEALHENNRNVPESIPDIQFTAQGGLGTAQEHNFLLDHYELDSIGWGSPFLLVPEVSCVDDDSRERLCKAKEDDLYLSGISPLGVPFNNLRGNTKEKEKIERIKAGKPGSPCVKKYLAFSTEFTDKPLCTASRKYQNLKIKELNMQDLDDEDYEMQYDKITEKECICTGLGSSFLLQNGLSTKVEGEGVSICPGPNMAYFSEIVSLRKMVDHIYGRTNLISRMDRPHMFIKELNLYVDQFKKLVEEYKANSSKIAMKKMAAFSSNIRAGIEYYRQLLSRDLVLVGVSSQRFTDGLNSAQFTVDAWSKVFN
jgi:hypothetical protein